MRILTLLPASRTASLRRALAPGDDLITPGTVAAFVTAAEGRRGDVVLVDPVLLTDDEWVRVVGKSGDRVLIYAALDSRTAARVVSAAKAGVGDMILADVDDEAVTLRRRLSTFRRPAPPARVLANLATQFERLPAALQCAALPLFTEAPVRRWVEEFADDSGLSRRTVDRWINHVGIAGTGALLDVARLARSWVPIVEEKLDPGSVARTFGFDQRRMLWRHARRLVGVAPPQFGSAISVDQFVDRLTAHARGE